MIHNFIEKKMINISLKDSIPYCMTLTLSLAFFALVLRVKDSRFIIQIYLDGNLWNKNETI